MSSCHIAGPDSLGFMHSDVYYLLIMSYYLIIFLMMISIVLTQMS